MGKGLSLVHLSLPVCFPAGASLLDTQGQAETVAGEAGGS